MKTASFLMFLIEHSQTILMGLSVLFLTFLLGAYYVSITMEKDFLEGRYYDPYIKEEDPGDHRMFTVVASPFLLVIMVFCYIDSWAGSGID